MCRVRIIQNMHHSIVYQDEHSIGEHLIGSFDILCQGQSAHWTTHATIYNCMSRVERGYIIIGHLLMNNIMEVKF